jgi:prophage regulatory protein
MQSNSPQPEHLLRVRDVVVRVPVSKSTWWAWVRKGYAPRPIRVGENVTCWRESEINAFIEKAGLGQVP